MSKKRGGPRRTPVPEIDEEHLLDICLSHVKKVGEAGAFALGKYMKTEASHAVKGAALADLLYLLEEFHKVSPSLEFKYSTLKTCFTQVLQQFPGIKEKWPVSEQGHVAKSLADGMLVVCNHARRIKRDKAKFAEASKNLTSFQVEKLEEIKKLVSQKQEETKQEVEPESPTTPKRGSQMPRQLALPLLDLQVGSKSLRSHPLKRSLRKISCWLQPRSLSQCLPGRLS